MSTKIYQAWRVERIGTFTKLEILVQRIRLLCTAARDQFLREAAERFYAQRRTEEQTIGHIYHRDIWTPYCLDRKKSENPYCPELNVVFTPSRGGVLILCFAESSAYRFDQILDQVGEKWGYWDNSDRDEDVTAQRWNQRRRDWKKILDQKNGLSAAEFGYTRQILTQHLPWPDRLWDGEPNLTREEV